jgi:hypothetical protein
MKKPIGHKNNTTIINLNSMERTFKVVSKAIPVKPYSIGELARIYNVSLHTMNQWLYPHMEAIGKTEEQGRMFTVKQVLIIFDKLGLPGYAED